MPARYRIAISTLVASALLAFAAPAAFATAFNISYSGTISNSFTGTFNGDISIANPDIITNITGMMFSVNGGPTIDLTGAALHTPLCAPGTSRNTISISDGTLSCIELGDATFGGAVIFTSRAGATSIPNSPNLVNRLWGNHGFLSCPGPLCYIPSAWSVVAKPTSGIPEPTAATLFSFGLISVVASVRRGKRS